MTRSPNRSGSLPGPSPWRNSRSPWAPLPFHRICAARGLAYRVEDHGIHEVMTARRLKTGFRANNCRKSCARRAAIPPPVSDAHPPDWARCRKCGCGRGRVRADVKSRGCGMRVPHPASSMIGEVYDHRLAGAHGLAAAPVDQHPALGPLEPGLLVVFARRRALEARGKERQALAHGKSGRNGVRRVRVAASLLR